VRRKFTLTSILSHSPAGVVRPAGEGRGNPPDEAGTRPAPTIVSRCSGGVDLCQGFRGRGQAPSLRQSENVVRAPLVQRSNGPAVHMTSLIPLTLTGEIHVTRSFGACTFGFQLALGVSAAEPVMTVAPASPHRCRDGIISVRMEAANGKDSLNIGR
jgi:hypothetical protein